jgi:large repetitive protein
MAFGARTLDRKRSAASAAVVLLSSAAVIAAAFTADGFHNTSVELHDSGVWVTRGSDELGRLNTDVARLDVKYRPVPGEYKLLYQDGRTVFAHVGDTLLEVNVVRAETQSAVELPPAADLAIGGSARSEIVAFTDPASGGVWIYPAAQAIGFTLEEDLKHPMLVQGIGADPRVAVASDGSVFVLSTARKQLLRVSREGVDELVASLNDPGASKRTAADTSTVGASGDSTTSDSTAQTPALSFTITPELVYDLSGVGDLAGAEVRTVGERPVVLVGSNLIRPNGTTMALGAYGENPRIQDSGPRADSVVVVSDSKLMLVPLADGPTNVIFDGGVGGPSAPVVVSGCIHAVWASNAGGALPMWIARCGDGPADLTIDKRTMPGAKPGVGIVLRANQDIVVTNDEEGKSYVKTRDGVKQVNNWDEVSPFEINNKNGDGPGGNGGDPKECSFNGENQRPLGADDSLGARPGRPTILRVLDNDEDPNCDVLTVAADGITGFDPAKGTLDVVDNGQSLQFTPAPGTEGEQIMFRYVATDGLPESRSDAAQVTVTVRRAADNEPPRLRPGVSKSKTTVESGKQVTYDVLADWIDPDGDLLRLEGASLDNSAKQLHTVRTGAAGRLTFVAGASPGPVQVALKVSDERNSTTDSQLEVDVQLGGTPLAPVTHSDVVTGFVGRVIVASPLVNDIDPNEDPLTLVGTNPEPKDGLSLDSVSGTVSLRTDQPGSRVVRYDVTDTPTGAGKASKSRGVIRFNVLDKGTSHAPVAMLDTVVLPVNKSINLDVLANDLDLDGDVITVTAVEPVTPADSQFVGVSLLENRLVRLSAKSRALGPVMLRYTASDGTTPVTGTVMVQTVPAVEKNQPPLARPDRVQVRQGDVVSIAVLANDIDPDGDPMRVLDKVEPAAGQPAQGQFSTDGTTVRFHAPDKPGTVNAIYSVEDPSHDTQGSQVTIDVRGLDGLNANRAPVVHETVARVYAGNTTIVKLPLDGSDPDGDSVTVKGLGSIVPGLGTVSAGADGRSVEYVASRSSAGTDTFTVALQDRFGMEAEAKVRIGVVPKPTVNQPPVVIDDIVPAKPGASLSVDVLYNDTDAEDGKPTFADKQSFDSLDPAFAVKIVDGRITVTAPRETRKVNIPYTAVDALGATTTGYLVLDVNPSNNGLPPVAFDDDRRSVEVAATDTVIDVDVLANDLDPDTSPGSLTADVWDAKTPSIARKGSKRGSIVVTLQDLPSVVPYAVIDPEGNRAMGIVRVPAKPRPPDEVVLPEEIVVNQPPQLKPGAPRFVSTLFATPIERFDINDFVVDPEGLAIRLTGSASVTAQHGDGSTLVVNETTLRFAPDPNYSGPASIAFEVMDRADLNDPTVAKARFQIVIQIAAKLNQPPVAASTSVVAEQGEAATAFDVRTLLTDPDAKDAGTLTVAAAPKPTGPTTGFTANFSNGTFSVAADAGLPVGTKASWTFTGTDGEAESNVGTIEVVVTASRRPLARVNVIDAGKIDRTQAHTFTPLTDAANPFPDTPLQIVGLATLPGNQGTAATDGTSIVLTPGTGYVGTITLSYAVADKTKATERNVIGIITANVVAAPDTPAAPTVLEVRSKTVVLQWQAPSANGDPITDYTVVVNSGDAQVRTFPVSTTALIATPLDNNRPYSFRIIATNETGSSQPSVPSAVVTPDQRPDKMLVPTVAFVPASTGALDLTFAPGTVGGAPGNSPGGEGSAIIEYQIQSTPALPAGIMPAVAGTTRLAGLTNGTAYRFQVRAMNASAPGDWSDPSAAETPAAVPGTPIAPVGTRVDDPLGGRVNVVWTAPAENGAPIMSYTLQVFSGGSQVRPPITGISGSTLSQEVTGLANATQYSFNVLAANRAGPGLFSAPSGSVPVFSRPIELPVAPMIGEGNQLVGLTFATPNANGSPITRYQTRVYANGSLIRTDTTNFPVPPPIMASNVTIGGLTNGTTYAFEIRACNQPSDTYCAAWSPRSATAVPYGPVGAPSISFVRQPDGLTAAFLWSGPPTNGRPIVRYEVSHNGGAWTNVGMTTIGSYGAPPGQTVTVAVRAVDGAGQVGPAATASFVTSPPPPPTVTVTVGTCPEDDNSAPSHFSSGPACSSPGGFISAGVVLTVDACANWGAAWIEPDSGQTRWLHIIATSDGAAIVGWWVNAGNVNTNPFSGC